MDNYKDAYLFLMSEISDTSLKYPHDLLLRFIDKCKVESSYQNLYSIEEFTLASKNIKYFVEICLQIENEGDLSLLAYLRK